ncbi:hypothetical protein F4V43_14970 [Paenibacillus spiritus]|uniref:3D domain-containing protein n=2 Tax=Paenibacillus TaxID=44249 RepID=A0A5J5FZU9_9BACL|nr:hypothetical protein F4V43_14970 [Paenibacillus spiritus]
MHKEQPALGRAIEGDPPRIAVAAAADDAAPERGVGRRAEYREAARAAAEAAQAKAEEQARLQAAERLRTADPAIPVSAPEPEQIIRTFTVTATGYTAGYESTGKRPNHPEYGITYSGVKVRRDKNAVSTIAADPKVLPLGSILYIPGYGYAVVADTGSAIKGQKIDLYFATTKQVYNEWGKKKVEVQLIRRGSGKCSEAMLRDLARTIRTYDFVPQSKLDELI